MSDTPSLFALHQAAKEGNAPFLKKASKRDINRGDQDGWTAMHWAAWNGNPEGLKIIISKGGEVDIAENNGNTPLHVAAMYGHEGALELLISRNANLYALDDNGRTAAKVAALHGKAECCRFLDTLGIRWEVENQEYVHKLQKKAMKDLQKRTKKSTNDSSGSKLPISYSYATAPSSAPNRDVRPSSSGPTGRRGQRTSVQEALRQNFELRQTNSNENVGFSSSNDALEASRSAVELGTFPSSAGSTFRPVRRLNQGPLINALSGLPLRIEPDDATGVSLPPGLILHSSDNILRSHGSGSGLPQMQLVASQATSFQNDSPLATFLHSLDLVDFVERLHNEKLDLEALAMCNEEDLTSIGLPLGPRKKILHAMQRRKKTMANPSRKMTESEL